MTRLPRSCTSPSLVERSTTSSGSSGERHAPASTFTGVVPPPTALWSSTAEVEKMGFRPDESSGSAPVVSAPAICPVRGPTGTTLTGDAPEKLVTHGHDVVAARVPTAPLAEAAPPGEEEPVPPVPPGAGPEDAVAATAVNAADIQAGLAGVET